MTFDKTYEISKRIVPPLEWKEFKSTLLFEWEHLLCNDSVAEKDFQKFLETNPCMIPGAHGLSLTSGHAPIYASVFSQPVLPGFKTKKPDFMWIATCSYELNPVLLEIEDPKKKWFTKKGQPTAQFTQAYNQLNEWRAWFANPTNIHIFIETYKINLTRADGRQIVPHYVLIYGRRSKVEDKKTERSVNKKTDETIMTYDRLSPSFDQSNYLCIKIKKSNFVAITFPPTARIGPNIIKEWIGIDDIDSSIRSSSLLSKERKKFLLKRIPYWKEWAKNKNKGSINTGDWE